MPENQSHHSEIIDHSDSNPENVGFVEKKKIASKALVKKIGFKILEHLSTSGHFMYPYGYNTSVSNIEHQTPRNVLTTEELEPDSNSESLIEPDMIESVSFINLEESVSMMEKRGYAKDVPSFSEQVNDGSRTNKIKHLTSEFGTSGNSANGRPVLIRTEQESLKSLQEFLTEVSKDSDEHKTIASDMLENLTYIGEKERTEAVQGIAESWKRYLGEDPSRQLCVLTETSAKSGMIKSDAFLLDSILGQFTETELLRFGDRIVTSLGELTQPPDKVKVVPLDDWIISGQQMREAISDVMRNPTFLKYVQSVEIQLVTSTIKRIKDGFRVRDGFSGQSTTIPIRSYFRSLDAQQETIYSHTGHRAYETGSHSSVDYDFEISYIQNMRRELEWITSDEKYQFMPGATCIVREYRTSQLANIARHSSRASTLGRNEGIIQDIDSTADVFAGGHL